MRAIPKVCSSSPPQKSSAYTPPVSPPLCSLPDALYSQSVQIPFLSLVSSHSLMVSKTSYFPQPDQIKHSVLPGQGRQKSRQRIWEVSECQQFYTIILYIRHILTYVVITFERHSLPFNEKFVLKIAKDFEMDQNNYWISLMSILFCLFDSMRFLCLCVLCVLKFCKLSIENQNHTLGRFCCFFSL